MKVGIRIMPKKEVLDSPGRTVLESLKRHDFSLSECRIGKFIELDVEASTSEQALVEGKKMAQQLLVNPLIEDFEMVIL